MPFLMTTTVGLAGNKCCMGRRRPRWSAAHRPLGEKMRDRVTTAGCETSLPCGSKQSSMRAQTPLLIVASMHAMKGTAEEPLDGGASTHRWVRVPARGPTAAPDVYLTSSPEFGTIDRSLWRTRERRVRSEMVGARVWSKPVPVLIK
jgi:hypothetical protein